MRKVALLVTPHETKSQNTNMPKTAKPEYQRVIQCSVGVGEVREGGVVIGVSFDDLTPDDKRKIIIESLQHTIRLADNFGLSIDDLIIEYNRQVKIHELENLIQKKEAVWAHAKLKRRRKESLRAQLRERKTQ